MCGICGVCAPGSEVHDGAARVATMLATLVHRGPDASGAHVEASAALGSRRLAIIDLLGGDQPIYSEDRSVCLVYNGEIYNYRELRKRLLDRGHRLATETDSETLVHLYEDHGIGFVPELNGMFAFALWDARRRTLYLVRDRFGVKPLYYHWDGRTLSFASEVRALLAVGTVRPALDPDALVELLTFQNILSERSLFRDVSLLPPARILRLDDNGLTVESFWEGLPEPDSALDRQTAIAGVREHFDAAVKRQLVSDVEVASYLSSGLDSSAVSASARRHLSRLTTFSTGFDVTEAEGIEIGFDESGPAAALAATLDTHHHELRLDAHDMEMVLPRVVLHLEEPRMNFSYPNYLTAGFASRWVKVVLSSVGGDELFAGYPWRYEIAGQPAFEDRYFEYWSRLLSSAELANGLAPELLADVDIGRTRRLFDKMLAPTEHLPDIERIFHFELRTYLHGLLVIEDKLSMAHSLESRVPFLDNELVKFALTIPAELKLAGARSKDLFRRAMAGRLPAEVLNRGKTGFIPPQAAWFRNAQREYVERVLLSDRFAARKLLRPEFVSRLLHEQNNGRADRRLAIWTLLCLEWWHRIFIDGEHAA
jgi:asparagine synthase (glutamine-hydrolysing)